MSELLNSGKVGLTVFRNLAEQRQAIVRNWDDSGLLEGLRGMKKANTAQLMENQAQAMLNEVTLDSSAGRFDTVAFPIVRRVFSRLLANEIVSVQPLALPSGLLFYMDARVSFDGSDTTFNNPVTPSQIQLHTKDSTITEVLIFLSELVTQQLEQLKLLMLRISQMVSLQFLIFLLVLVGMYLHLNLL
jgi:hypothetical protein